MNLIFRKIIAFLRRDMILQYSYRFAFFLNLGVIVFGVAAYYFLSILFDSAQIPQFREYGSGYFSFVLIGISCFNYMNVALSTFSNSIRQAQVNGTLEAMILTRTNLTSIVIFSSLWAFLYTLIQMVLYILIGWGCFDFDISRLNLSASCVMLMVIALSFSPLGILSASFILAFKRGDPIFYAISGISALLGGGFLSCVRIAGCITIHFSIFADHRCHRWLKKVDCLWLQRSPTGTGNWQTPIDHRGVISSGAFFL